MRHLIRKKVRLKRDISTLNLLMVSLGSIVGSGWLFSPFICAQIAGSNALMSWVLAAIFMWFVALPMSELGTMLPIAGGMTNYPSFTHGRSVGFLFAWASWLSYVVVTPIEIQAIMQYLGRFFPAVIYASSTEFDLTPIGYVVAISAMFFIVVLNSFGVKLLAQFNMFASIFKFAMPLIAITALISTSPPARNISIHLNDMQSWSDIFSALSMGGVIFALTGFQNGLMMAGEVQNPQRNIPIAVLGSIGLALVLYFLLQWSFLVAVPENQLLHGWQQLNFPGSSGPFVGLTILIGLSWIASLLMIEAVISPLATTLLYTASSARILYGMSLNDYLPEWVAKLNRYRIPYASLLINFLVGALSFLPFPGWKKMVAFLSSCSILSFSAVPICLLAFRVLQPDKPRPFRMPCVYFLSHMAFCVCNLMLFWCGFGILWKLDVALLLGLGLYYFSRSSSKVDPHLGSLFWFISYMGCLSVLSYFGSFGGIGYLCFPYDVMSIVPLSILFLYWSQRVLIEGEIPAALVS